MKYDSNKTGDETDRETQKRRSTSTKKQVNQRGEMKEREEK